MDSFLLRGWSQVKIAPYHSRYLHHFTRENRKIVLTDDGKYLLAKAKEIIELIDKTEANINQPNEMISGDFFIGGGETKAMHFVWIN